MNKKEEFLTKYTDNICQMIKKSSNFNVVSDFLNTHLFKSSIPYNYDTFYDYLEDAKNVLDKISSIIYKPHTSSINIEVVKRSELANRLNSNCFKETLKDTKNWKNKDGELVPEYVHSEEYLDTLVTYENRFIAMLILLIDERLTKYESDLVPLINPLEKQYSIKGISYGAKSIAKDFQIGSNCAQDNFVLESADKNDLIDCYSKIKKRIKRLKNTEFYRKNVEFPVVAPVNLTNILLHDPLYFCCYKFYLKSHKEISKDANLDAYYYNFALLNILNTVKGKNDFFVKVNEVDGRLLFEDFEIRKDNFCIKFSCLDTINSIKIIVTLHGKDGTSNISTYLVIFSYRYSKSNANYIKNIIDNNYYQYDDIVLVCDENETEQISNILNISVYNSKNYISINNFLSSLTMCFITNTDVYKNVCPVCGRNHVNKNSCDYLCRDCKAHYSIVGTNNEYIVWMKSLRRNEIWK